MIHVRIVSPPDLTPQLLPLPVSDMGGMNLAVAEASTRDPDGDAMPFDVLQGRANDVIARMRVPPSWYGLLDIAGLTAALGLVTNSQILIVGAMVVGPEYGAIVALAYGVTKREYIRVGKSAKALVVGFGLAVVAALLLGLLIRTSRRAQGLLVPCVLLGVGRGWPSRPGKVLSGCRQALPNRPHESWSAQ